MLPSRKINPAITGVCLIAGCGAVRGNGDSLPARIPEFIDQHCASCHDDVEMEGHLDLWSLSEQPITSDTLQTWIKAHDRAKAGEMPPKKKARPEKSHLDEFLKLVSAEIIETEQTMQADIGRSVKRRLNRYEYENSVRDLLSLPYLTIKESLPEDSVAHGYNKSGEALDVSHVQLSRYLGTADTALREAVINQVDKPQLLQHRYYAWDQYKFTRGNGPEIRKTYPVYGYKIQEDLNIKRTDKRDVFIRPLPGDSSDPARRHEEAVVTVMSAYEHVEIQFDEFRAPVAGRYRLKFAGYTVWVSPDYTTISKGRRTEPITIYSDFPVRTLRRLGHFDFTPELSVQEIEVWLKAGETIRPDAARLVRSRPPDFQNPFLEEDGMPGVAYKWMEVEGPLFESWPPPGHKLLFGDLKTVNNPANATDAYVIEKYPNYDRPDDVDWSKDILSGIYNANNMQPPRAHVFAESENQAKDADRLLKNFLKLAYRGPVNEAEQERFLGLILEALDVGHTFTESMIAGYTAVLASPGFIYHQATAGKLDGYELAERLSYFLWNSAPDDELLKLAANESILNSSTFNLQVERMLDDARSRRFFDAFLNYWLDLRNMEDSSPDLELYPEYQLDDALVESMVEETQLYLQKLIKDNLGIGYLIDSDFVMINERLATLYEIEGVRGSAFRPVELSDDSPRGGLMTQASVLKVTANGTTSSPVTRGVWMMERILGEHIPPPPPSVQAIESDIRGAKTIREQLALHRSQESCNVCHVKIDPAGFALENFDVMGGWRDHYRTTSEGEGEPVQGVGHNGYAFKYRKGLPVDAAGQLPDGRAFHNISELKQHLLTDKEKLAKNFVEQLAVFATGTPVRFSDREEMAAILIKSESENYGVRSLITELVKSDLFIYK